MFHQRSRVPATEPAARAPVASGQEAKSVYF